MPQDRVVIRPFTSSDEDAFRQLYRDCLAHYRIAPASVAQEDRIIRHLNAERHLSCHIAFHGSTPVGFATWGLQFPSGPGVSLVMKELFVSDGARGLGVGRALLSALVDVAREEECERFDWATDGTNHGAQAFYQKIDATRIEKQNFRILKDGFDAFQSRLTARA